MSLDSRRKERDEQKVQNLALVLLPGDREDMGPRLFLYLMLEQEDTPGCEVTRSRRAPGDSDGDSSSSLCRSLLKHEIRNLPIGDPEMNYTRHKLEKWWILNSFFIFQIVSRRRLLGLTKQRGFLLCRFLTPYQWGNNSMNDRKKGIGQLSEQESATRSIPANENNYINLQNYLFPTPTICITISIPYLQKEKLGGGGARL